jgi:hypothetical protein
VKSTSGISIYSADLIGFPEDARPGQIDPAVLRHLVLIYVPLSTFLFMVALDFVDARRGRMAVAAVVSDPASTDKVRRQAENADDDQVDRHHVIEQSWYHQDENAGDQGDNRLKRERI